MAFSRIKFTIFFVLLPGPFCSAVLWQDLFVFLLRISCHSNVCKKFDLCCTDFRKAITCLCVTHTAQISTGFVAFVKIYLGKRHWRKKLYFSSISPKIYSTTSSQDMHGMLSSYEYGLQEKYIASFVQCVRKDSKIK